MKLSEFSDWKDPEYIESCNKIISNRNCRDIEFCIKCPFHWHNLTKEFADCTEYSNTNDCVLQDDKLVQSAKEFLELVKFQRRVESTTAKSVIEESECLIEPLSDEELTNTQAKFVATLQEEFAKEEKYIIMDDEYEIIHRTKTLKEAEDELSIRLIDGANNELLIAKIIKKAKLEKKVVWSE